MSKISKFNQVILLTLTSIIATGTHGFCDDQVSPKESVDVSVIQCAELSSLHRQATQALYNEDVTTSNTDYTS